MNDSALRHPSEQRAPRRDAARNRAALISAGAELFGAAGPMPTLDDVARLAGVGVGTAYRHFPNKYVLAQAVFAETMRSMLDAAERSTQLDDATEGFTAFFEAVLEPQAGKRALGAVLRSAPGSGPDAGEIQGRIERCIDVLLRRGHEQHVIRAALTATDVGVLMSAMVHIVEAFGDSDPLLWRRLLPVLLDGIRADAPTPLVGQPLDTAAFLDGLINQA